VALTVHKIVSGGQTGVDRAALDVAIFHEIAHGGWCPLGRLAEDGAIPEIYQLQENDSPDYAKRTEKNVIHSDATLILYWEKLRGGTKLTRRLAGKHKRPNMLVDLSESPGPREVREWLTQNNVGVLNVAGPRASSHDSIGKSAESFLTFVFQDLC
jgi:hypothetical protein